MTDWLIAFSVDPELLERILPRRQERHKAGLFNVAATRILTSLPGVYNSVWNLILWSAFPPLDIYYMCKGTIEIFRWTWFDDLAYVEGVLFWERQHGFEGVFLWELRHGYIDYPFKLARPFIK